MEAIAFIVLIVAVFVVLFFLMAHEFEEEEKFQLSLPTLEEARSLVGNKYPNYSDCFVVESKIIGSISIDPWAGSVFIYADFLVCEEIGISIRLRNKSFSKN